jgi:branched-chain amino acid aminotransferase
MRQPKQEEMWVWINGNVVPRSQGTISVFDHSFIYGDGVFEGIKVFLGRIFHLASHIRRLFASARFLAIDIPASEADICRAIVELVRQNNMPGGYVRPIVTRGEGPLGLRNMDRLGRPNMVIICQRDRIKTEQELLATGLRAKTVATRRTPPGCLDPRAKTCNYLNNILADLERRAAGVDFGLMLDTEGYVCEGPAENVFIVKDGRLETPLAAKCLDGITRRSVMVAARRARWPVREANLTLYDVYTADEMFATGSMNEITWIREVDGRPIGDGKAGPVSRKLLKVLREEGFRTGVRVFGHSKSGR